MTFEEAKQEAIRVSTKTRRTDGIAWRYNEGPWVEIWKKKDGTFTIEGDGEYKVGAVEATNYGYAYHGMR